MRFSLGGSVAVEKLLKDITTYKSKSKKKKNFEDPESVGEEIAITLEVLCRYEYPDYEDVQELIGDMPEWFVEYSLENHECMETVWNTINDRGTLERMGKEANERGCFQVMQACYYTILQVFRTLHKKQLKDPRVLIAWRRMKFLINVAWHGVGEWRM